MLNNWNATCISVFTIFVVILCLRKDHTSFCEYMTSSQDIETHVDSTYVTETALPNFSTTTAITTSTARTATKKSSDNIIHTTDNRVVKNYNLKLL